ncbi:8779_t:CDS:2 [Gigaspora margarita]|uniref:8779_t:CDS:1 n=1 Tax=Gigaspora margarita TaxID=4874 RepID=A0ABN7V0U1_GIGMA|nr:8779_t:CDS:2 [Gigaspora margarita]
MIEFVTEVMNNKVLSRTEEAHYTTVLYFLQLLLQANICLRKELIQPDLCGKSFSKSLLHDKLVSLKVASYLHSQKFKVDPIMVKSYFEQQILLQLNIKSVQHISVRTACRWMHKLGFCYQRYQKEVSQLERFMSKWNDPDYKIRTFSDLNNSENELVWVTHNETIFYVYDGLHFVWVQKESNHYARKD